MDSESILEVFGPGFCSISPERINSSERMIVNSNNVRCSIPLILQWRP